MSYFNIVAETNENTVVTQYEPVKKHSDVYQSEAELEAEFIRMLTEQGYEYINAHSEDDMIANLRKKLEELNDYVFSDSEWERFFKECIANKNDRPEDKTRKIQEDSVQVLKRDDNMTKNITLIDRKNIHNNRLQIINQYVVTTNQGARHDNRYDVTVLVNGFPMVHIELKRRGVAIREAFNQITRYERDSFSAGYGLFEYVQIYVISNGTNTKYYSNSTRYNAIKDAEAAKTKKRKTSNSFEFTSFWADANNRVIPDLIDFTKTFFAKNTILNILTKYCIFTSENMLMVMRPYQITATERILNRIEIAHNYHKQGDIAAGGYIWHTTGSGKTLTSFKTARLASSLPYIDTLEKVYGIKDVLHLHGGIPSCCEIAPIMGHGNKYIIDSYRRKAKEAQEEYVEWYESICNAIADFCESLYKDTDAIINENDDFFSALWDVNQVVCLGLSFGDVDVPYLDRIEYEVRPETKWLVYYHSDEDLKRLKSVFGITGISRKFEVYFRKSDNFWDR